MNFIGAWHTDPRDELKHRAQVATRQGDDYVSVPISLAMACAELHECDATTVVTGDEDGPLPVPLTIHCRLPAGHALTRVMMHSNGYTNWED